MLAKLPKNLDSTLASHRRWKFDRGTTRDLRSPDGILPFQAGSNSGHLLIDRSLSYPVQIISFDNVPVDKAYISTQLAKAFDKRLLLAKAGRLSVGRESAFRLLHENADGLPGLAVDIFANYGMIHNYSQHWEPFIQHLGQTLMHHQDLGLQGVYYVDHTRSISRNSDEDEGVDSSIQAPVRKKSLCILGRKPVDHTVVVSENNLKFLISLDRGSACGLYLDQRDNRQRLVDLFTEASTAPPTGPIKSAPGAVATTPKPTFLNTFCFTGSFSVFAAKRGVRTTNIDLSGPSLEVAKENFRLNRLDPREHDWHSREVNELMEAVNKGGKSFDCVLLDPPTYAHVRQSDGRKVTFSTATHYHKLLYNACSLVNPGGHVVAFSNTHSLSRHQWNKQLDLGLNKVLDQKKKEEENLRKVQYRSLLRKKFKGGTKGAFSCETPLTTEFAVVKKKQRLRMSAKKELELSEDDTKQIWGFETLAEWTQSSDFGWLEEDPLGQYLQGTVLRRNKDGIVKPVLDVIKEDLKKSKIIDAKGKPILRPPKPEAPLADPPRPKPNSLKAPPPDSKQFRPTPKPSTRPRVK